MFRSSLVLLLLAVATSADAQPKLYAVAPGRSRVTFEAKYPLGDFSGATDRVKGEVRLNSDNVPEGIAGTVTVDPATLGTGIEARDRDLRKALETDRYPELTFTVESVQASFPSLAERADITLTITGVMLIRGVKRPMTWTARARTEEKTLWVRGEAELRMSAFGIPPPRKLFLTVGDTVRVGFDVRLEPRE